MSEANAADLAPVIDAAPAPDTSVADGQQQQSSEVGQGDAPTGVGQGAGNETPPAGGAPAEGEAAIGGEGGAAQGAPEQYAAFVVPDGYVLEGDSLTGVQDFSKAHNFTQEQAQALVDLGLKQADSIAARFVAEAQSTPVPMSQHWAGQWAEQTTADPELGGAKLKDTMAMATRVFQTFATPELGQFLDQTGLNHHPELIRFMTKIGQAVSEDTLVTSQGGSQPRAQVGRNPAGKLYPNMN